MYTRTVLVMLASTTVCCIAKCVTMLLIKIYKNNISVYLFHCNNELVFKYRS